MHPLAETLKRRALLAVFLSVGALGAVVALIWMAVCIIFVPFSERPWRIAIALDQLANTATGGNEDETISSRASRLRREGRGWACVLCRLLDLLQPDHCSKSEGT